MSTNELKIFCTNVNEYIDINGGDTLLEVCETIEKRLDFTPICAHVNNKLEDLNFRVFMPKHVHFLGLPHPDAMRIYIRSLCMVLSKAVNDLMPDRCVSVHHSISNGYFCTVSGGEKPLTVEEVSAIKKQMRFIVAQDVPFIKRERLTVDVIEMFRKAGMTDKVTLLETSNELYTTYHKLDNFIDSYYGPLVVRSGLLSVFDLVPYKDGMLLLGPSGADVTVPSKAVKQKKMFQAFTDYVQFNHIIGVKNAGELNRAIKNKRASDLINVAEALHNKQFTKIAAEITERYKRGGARVVLIAGPSSSGKTTSSHRLAIQLITNLIVPKVIALDNYFVDRHRTPKDENGDYDYESLYALDLEQFNKDINDLIAGKEVAMPTYNFETGEREYRGNTLRLEENNILLMEGIHGLNPELTQLLPDEQKFRVYVSALTTLNIDNHNWISTSDNRLLRRILRDHKYRGVNAAQTIARWPSVRRGEEKWIFPFQENADAMFNSSLLFELSVMRNYLEPILRGVPANAPQYAEAYRLRRFLSLFEPLDEKDIPSTSLLREFLGGSSFHI